MIVVPGLFVVLLSPAAPPSSVFHIEKEENRNEVHYRAQVTSACELPTGDSLRPYWIMREKGEGVIEDLMIYETPAYGIREQEKMGPRQLFVRLEVLPSMPLLIRASPPEAGPCALQAFVRLEGKTIRLSHIRVPKGSIAGLSWFELHGHSQAGPVKFRLGKNGQILSAR